MKGFREPDLASNKRQRRRSLMEINVNMSNGKAGKLVIHEGETADEVVKSFSKAFSLNQEAYKNLRREVNMQYKLKLA